MTTVLDCFFPAHPAEVVQMEVGGSYFSFLGPYYFSSPYCIVKGGFYLFCVDGKDAFREQHQGSEMVIWS